MNIVATAVEPEFLTLNVERDGAGNYIGGVLIVELARMEISFDGPTDSGSVQLILMRSDLETLNAALASKEDVLLARFHAAGWLIADDGDPYRED